MTAATAAIAQATAPEVPDLAGVVIGDEDPSESELTPLEERRYSEFRVPKRRREWLGGRRAAKQAVRHRHTAGVIEIDASGHGPEAGRPFYRLDGKPGPFDLSIAHSGSLAVAAISRREGDRIGIDVEPVCERAESFENVAFSVREIGYLAAVARAGRPRAVTAAWIAKECLLKAVGTGLRLPLRSIEVLPAVLRLEGTTECALAELFRVAPEVERRFPPAATPASLRIVDLDGMLAGTLALGGMR